MEVLNIIELKYFNNRKGGKLKINDIINIETYESKQRKDNAI